MKDIELEKIIESMKAAGCFDADTDKVRNMHKAGMDSEIIHCLRKCRCALMEDLRDSQKRVDRMDRLIRITESS